MCGKGRGRYEVLSLRIIKANCVMHRTQEHHVCLSHNFALGVQLMYSSIGSGRCGVVVRTSRKNWAS